MMRGFCPRGLCPVGTYVLMELCMEGVLSKGGLSEEVLSKGFCPEGILPRIRADASSQVRGRCSQVAVAARCRGAAPRTSDRGSGRTRTIQITTVDFASRCVKKGFSILGLMVTCTNVNSHSALALSIQTG